MEIDQDNSFPSSESGRFHQHRVDANALTLDAAGVARGMGYCRPASQTAGASSSDSSRQRSMPAYVAEIVEAMLARGRELIDARWMWVVVPVAFGAEGDELVCEPPVRATLKVGKYVCSQLRGSAAVAAFVVTIGGRLEEEARAMMRDVDPLGGYVLDTVGSMAAEALADLLEAEVAAFAQESGHNITNRFSPGYCSWETTGQQALFSLFPSDCPAGITLGPSSLMSPIKSVSGVIGLGENVEHRPYACDLCSMKACHQRLTESRF